MLLSRGLAVGGGRTRHIGIAAQDGIIGLLVQLSHELDIGAFGQILHIVQGGIQGACAVGILGVAVELAEVLGYELVWQKRRD